MKLEWLCWKGLVKKCDRDVLEIRFVLLTDFRFEIGGFQVLFLGVNLLCLSLCIRIYIFLSPTAERNQFQFQFRLQFRFRFQTQSLVENLVQRGCHSFASNCFVYPATQTIAVSFGWTLALSFTPPGSVLGQLKRAGENESRSSRQLQSSAFIFSCFSFAEIRVFTLCFCFSL